MDLKQYFRKLRAIEATLADPFPIVVSLETPDGGKAGMLSEVSRFVAAKMILEGRALVATDVEKELYRDQQGAAKVLAEKAELARRVQIAVISESDLRQVDSGKRNKDNSAVQK